MNNKMRAITCGTMLCLCADRLASAGDADDWQQQQLFDPSESLLIAEAKGRVTIYDGMPVEVVEKAMDQQFGRVDSMMFTRIRHATPEGEIVEDDGC